MDDSNDLFSAMDGEPRREQPKPAPARPAPARPAAAKASGEGYDASDIEVLEGLEPVRRRPGMYIGGTDEKALHHLFAEVIDNSMDEAVAGHATWIEVELDADGFVTVTDNGRGIPVDPHPKFQDKSALEVIMTTLHSGGKFDCKVYETSGGLHGVGVSVVNALSDRSRSRSRATSSSTASGFRAACRRARSKKLGDVHNRRGTTVRFHPDPEIFGKGAAFKPARLFRMARSKAYLFGGVEIRWNCAPALLAGQGQTPAKARVPLPRRPQGLSRRRSSASEHQVDRRALRRHASSKTGGHGSVEWAVTWLGGDGFLSSYCNTIPTPDGGTHEAGFRAALRTGCAPMASWSATSAPAIVTADDVMISAAGMLSVFIREPEFQGQTKDRLATAGGDAHRRERRSATPSTTGSPTIAAARPRKLLDWVIERAEERLRRRQEKEIEPQDRDAQAAPARQARRLHAERRRRHRALHRRGRLGRRLGQAGARPREPGDPAAARQDPQRRQRRPRQARRQPADRRPDPGARLRHRAASTATRTCATSASSS